MEAGAIIEALRLLVLVVCLFYLCLKACPPFTESVFFLFGCNPFPSGTPSVLSTNMIFPLTWWVKKNQVTNVWINYSFNKLKYIHDICLCKNVHNVTHCYII